MALRKFAGLETEYAVHASWTDQGIDDTVGFVELDDIVLELMHAAGAVTDAWVAESYGDHTWLPNGGLVYPDFGSHPEYATPETSDPIELIRQHKLGDVVLAAAASYGDANNPTIRRRIFKGNVDAYKNTFGTHESYCISARVDVPLVAPLLGSFLATRTLFTGAGGITQGRRQQWSFTRSPRAEFLVQLSGQETTTHRALVNLRDEAHADSETFKRLHLICGEANRCDVANFLKIGTTAIALSMIEDHRKLDHLILEDPMEALHLSANAPSLHALVRTDSGRTMSVLEHQMEWAQRAASYVEKYGENVFASPDTARQVVARWQGILDDLDVDPNRAHGKLDWVTKRNLIETRADRDHLPLGSPVLQQYDLRWGEVTEGNFVSILEEKGILERLVPELAIGDLTPPTDSRAALRGHLIQRHKRVLEEVRWDKIMISSEIPGAPILCVMDNPGSQSRAEIEANGMTAASSEELRLQFVLAEIHRNHGYENTRLGAETGQAFLACRDDATKGQRRSIATAVANGARNAVDHGARVGSAEDITALLRTFRLALDGVSEPQKHLDLLAFGASVSRAMLDGKESTDDRVATCLGILAAVDRAVERMRAELGPAHGRDDPGTAGPSLDLGGR